MKVPIRATALSALALAAICAGSAAKLSSSSVSLVRVPAGGIQPEVEVRDGIVHLIYFSGPAEHGDLNYVRSRDYGRTFSPPIRVNNTSGSAIAVGAIRGAQMVIGRNGRVHVAWNGSDLAQPRSGKEPPMLYARLNDAGNAFEPERNLITSAWGLNGGGTLAADQRGNVYVFWHAPPPGQQGEENRRVWMAKSSDDGKTFAHEVVAFIPHTGVCGCCGMHAFAADDGTLHVLFRSDVETVHRDMYLLTSRDQGRTFQGSNISPWNIGACVMSSEAFAQTKESVLAAWETEKQIYFGKVAAGNVAQPIGAPGKGDNRKYPALATNSQGETLLAWTEGTAFRKSGSLAWQIYDQDLKPEALTGHSDGSPVFSFPAAFARPDGNFVVVY
jgi:hypothetical protein